MNTEKMKLIAELAYPDATLGKHIDAEKATVISFTFDGWDTYEDFEPQENPEQELKLIRMYREWCLEEAARIGFGSTILKCYLFDALESTDTLLEVIARDML